MQLLSNFIPIMYHVKYESPEEGAKSSVIMVRIIGSKKICSDLVKMFHCMKFITSNKDCTYKLIKYTEEEMANTS